MEVVFFETAAGTSPIAKFIDSQPSRDQAALTGVLSEIEWRGFAAKGATFRQLEGKLWEVKIKATL